MNIDVFWDNDDKTILRFDYHKGWTWEDFSAGNKTMEQLLDAVNHKPFHIIANFDDGAFPPMGALGKFKTAQENAPEGTIVVVVGGGMFISSLVTAFSRIYTTLSKSVMVADSVDEARHKLMQLQ